MKIDLKNSEQAALLARYLSGEMDESECLSFEGLVNSDDENVKTVQAMKKQWKAIGSSEQPALPDTAGAWNALHTRLTEEKLIPGQSHSNRNFKRFKYTRIAALILALIGASAILYLSVKKDSSNVEMVNLNTSQENNTLIKTLEDGSVVYIGTNSLFSFPVEFSQDQRNVELKGEAFFDVAPNPGKPFIIETSNAIVEVLGTAFNVRTSGNTFELVVERGKVKVTLKDQPEYSEMVNAGEKVSTANNRIIKSKSSNSVATDWYKQRMHFKDEALHSIFKVLNRNFNTTFTAANPEIGNRKLTVTFDNETVETMTELICLSLNLKSIIKNDSIVLSENKAGARKD